MKLKTLLMLCLILGWPRLASAQVGVSLWPPVADIQVLPGESQTGTIQVQNPGGEAVEITAQALNCLTGLDGETILEGDDSSFVELRPCAGWVKINPEEFSLFQGGDKMVRYTVYAPQNAIGGYRLALVFQTKPKQVIGTATATAISARLVTLVNIQTVGTGTKRGELSRVELLNISGINFIGVTFKNTGTDLLRPTGILEIKNTADTAIGKLDINSEKYAALSGMERRYMVNVGHLNSGQYLLTATMDYGGAKPATAELKADIKQAGMPIWDQRLPRKK